MEGAQQRPSVLSYTHPGRFSVRDQIMAGGARAKAEERHSALPFSEPRRDLNVRRALPYGLPAAATLVIHQALLSRPFIDDSYIFYRYAANWAHGLGPVFNRGEHVEGFSSALWTLTLTAAAGLGIPPPRAAPILGIGFAIGCLVILAAASRALFPSQHLLAVLLPLALAGSPAFVTYATSGMDTVLFAFVLLWSVAAIADYVEQLREGVASYTSAALPITLLVTLVLARAEGPMYALALATGSFLLSQGTSTRVPLRLKLLLPVAAVLATGIVLAVRELVYGSLVPATVLAKGYVAHLAAHAGDPGALGALWETLWRGFSGVGWVGFVATGVIIAALLVSRGPGRRISSLGTLGALAIVIGLLTAVGSGGDWMPYRRLLIPAVPLLILLGAWGVAILAAQAAARLGRGLRLAPILTAGAGVFLAISAGGLSPGPTPSTYEATQLRRLARLVAHAPAPVRVLTNLAGILPYYAGSRTHVWDMLGLTDIHNATHGEIFSPEFGRTDPEYDFTRPFDLFVSNSSWDFALMLADASRRKARPPNRVLFSNRSWSSLPLYVVARSGSALAARLQRLCGCNPRVLSAAVSQQLLTALRATGAIPPGLLDAASSHQFFPT